MTDRGRGVEYPTVRLNIPVSVSRANRIGRKVSVNLSHFKPQAILHGQGVGALFQAEDCVADSSSFWTL